MTALVIGFERPYSLECMAAMAEPQVSIPDYPYPDGVPSEKRDAPTPKRGKFDYEDAVNGVDLVSRDHIMPGQELCEAFRPRCTGSADRAVGKAKPCVPSCIAL